MPVKAIEKAFKSWRKLAAVDVVNETDMGLGGRMDRSIIGTTHELYRARLGARASARNRNPMHCASDWYGVTNGP